MDISFENKKARVYVELCRQSRVIQETAESVVPDTDEDIGQIASLQSDILLKSKDITARGVLISGEACVSLIYLTEDRQKSSSLRICRSFSIEYEIADISSETVAQIKLDMQSCQARLINPRKVSVEMQICGELSCYRQQEMVVDSIQPKDGIEGLHLLYEEAELLAVNAACEKTFTITEQFPFPGAKPGPTRLVSSKVDMGSPEAQLVGSKLILKGNARINAVYLSNEANYPIQAEFTSPYSQIIDIGQDSMDSCQTHIELTSVYCDIVNAVNNEKTLELEIHAVVQLLCRCKRKIRYITDAYSNLMPAKCQRSAAEFQQLSIQPKQKLSCDERIAIGEDCTDVLSALVTIARTEITEGHIKATLRLDLIYKDLSGLLAAVSRSIALEGELTAAEHRLSSARLADIYIRPDGQCLDVHLALEVNTLSCERSEIETVDTVSLDEEAAYDRDSFPAISLVRREGERLWELARCYHSSVEAIETMMEAESNSSSKLLLIPKAL